MAGRRLVSDASTFARVFGPWPLLGPVLSRRMGSTKEVLMLTQKWPGVLWLIAGVSSGGIAFFLVDPLDLAIFIGGAVLAILLGIAR